MVRLDKGNAPLMVVIETLNGLGIPYTIQNGKHLKLKFEIAGHCEVIIIPRSPSCWRAAQNARATVRRILKRRGISLEVAA